MKTIGQILYEIDAEFRKKSHRWNRLSDTVRGHWIVLAGNAVGEHMIRTAKKRTHLYDPTHESGSFCKIAGKGNIPITEAILGDITCGDCLYRLEQGKLDCPDPEGRHVMLQEIQDHARRYIEHPESEFLRYHLNTKIERVLFEIEHDHPIRNLALDLKILVKQEACILWHDRMDEILHKIDKYPLKNYWKAERRKTSHWLNFLHRSRVIQLKHYAKDLLRRPEDIIFQNRVISAIDSCLNALPDDDLSDVRSNLSGAKCLVSTMNMATEEWRNKFNYYLEKIPDHLFGPPHHAGSRLDKNRE